MEILPYIIIAIVGLIAGIFSGITGGGGAIIMIPAFILAVYLRKWQWQQQK